MGEISIIVNKKKNKKMLNMRLKIVAKIKKE